MVLTFHLIDYTQTLLSVADTGWAIPVTGGAVTASPRAVGCAPLLITLEDTRVEGGAANKMEGKRKVFLCLVAPPQNTV